MAVKSDQIDVNYCPHPIDSIRLDSTFLYVEPGRLAKMAMKWGQKRANYYPNPIDSTRSDRNSATCSENGKVQASSDMQQTDFP